MNKNTFVLILSLTAYSGMADSKQKYILNGAVPFSQPVMRPYQHVRIGGAFGIEGEYSCGNFDFTASIASQLSGAADRLRTSLVNSVQGLLAALPELLLQRIRPDFYDLYQKLMVRAEADIRVAYQSCESWKTAFQDTDKGTKEIFKEAITVDWNSQVERNGQDIWSAQKEVEENAAEKGIKWCDGSYRGGKDTESLKPLRDAATAGFNTLMGMQCTNTSPITNPLVDDSPVYSHFTSPEEVQEFVVEAVGDYVFKANENSLREGSIPQGLNGMIKVKQGEIKDMIDQGLENKYFINGNNLRKFSAYPGGPKITSEVLEAISEMEDGIKKLSVDNLAYELAGANVIDQALSMKKILKAAKYIPEIQASNFMITTINKGLDEIDQQIKDLIFEKQLRETFYSETAANILDEYRAAKNTDSLVIPTIRERLKIENGGMVEKGEN